MVQPLDARLDALRARLGRQPYDAPALCEELVLLAALRRHDHGARLIAWLLQHRSQARLGPFFVRAILGRSRGTLPAELERHFEVDLAELDAALLERHRG